MRITITDKQFGEIISSLHDKPELIKILNKSKEDYEKSITTKKRGATKKAHSENKNRSKEKIENAMNLLRLEDKPITIYSVAKVSGMSYNTVKKYMS